MRIVIVGVGAMGSVYAALMADAGLDVTAVDTWADHVAAINAKGLTVSGASGERTVAMPAFTSVGKAGAADLVILATKADGVEAGARAALSILKPGGVVLTIQNGLGSADRVAAIVGADRTLIGVVGGFGASMVAPGHAHHNGWEFVRIGEYQGSDTARAERIADIWRQGGFKVLTFADIHRMIWEKFICNVTFSGTCALTNRRVGEVMADPDAWRIASGCAREAFAVAKAKGIAVGIDDVVAYVRAFGEKIPNARPSLLLDHLAGRRSEIDAINGAVPVEAAKVGLTAPLNETVAALIRAKERGFGATQA
jgi:2-dehydropantoate 2-reductase